MRALVTGGAGFIGSNLVDALVARGDEVVVVDDLSTGRRENVDPRVELIEASVLELPRVHFDAVFHLAAQIDVRRAVEDPGFDARVNVEGTIAVLEAALAEDAPLVLASTGGAIYGDAEQIPTPESAPVAPVSPYGVSKAAAELYCALFERLHGLPTVALRFANVYGPRQDPLGEGGVVAIFCAAAAGERAGATIYGDGNQTRDFVYVGDVVEALLEAADSPVPGAFNVSTGRETSVLELAETLGLEPAFASERSGEVRRSALDPSLAAERLGWSARTSLEQGLEATLDWVRAR